MKKLVTMLGLTAVSLMIGFGPVAAETTLSIESAPPASPSREKLAATDRV